LRKSIEISRIVAKYRMKKIIFVLLLSLTLTSCANQQGRTTPTPNATFESDIMPNKFSVFDNQRIVFDNWHMSLLLPKGWDINKYEFGMDNGFKIESYYFYGPEYPNGIGGKSYPSLSVRFHPVETTEEKSVYLEHISNWDKYAEFTIDQLYSPKEIGLNLDSANGYKCRFKDGRFNRLCYVVRAVNENVGAEIMMESNSYIFQKVEAQFLELIKSISFK